MSPPIAPTAHGAPEDDGVIDLDMPGVEALLAGAMALMTAYALGKDDPHRLLVARKAQANLACLAQHPQLSANFHRMALHIQRQWCQHASGPVGPDCAPQPQQERSVHNHAVVRQVSQALGLDNAQALVHLAPGPASQRMH